MKHLIPDSMVDKSLFEGDAMLLSKGDIEKNIKQYFRIGRQALDIIKWAISVAKIGVPDSILDLPCGSGRITRWLHITWPDARIFVSDISADEMRFCAEHFSGIPVQAHNNFHQISVPSLVDVAWCGSLITHIDAKRALQLLDWLMEQLKPGGASGGAKMS